MRLTTIGRGAVGVLWALLVLLLAGRASAAVTVASQVRAFDDNSEITWVSITISNPMSVEARCQIKLTGYRTSGGSGEVRQALAPIPPGATRTVNIPVPVINSVSGVLYEQGAPEVYLNFSAGWNNKKTVLYVADQGSQVNEDQLNEFTLRVAPEVKSRHSYSSSATATTPTLTEADRVVTQITPEVLPENWLCYVPLKCVIINSQVEKALSAPQKDALDTWVRSGGWVVYTNADSSTNEALGSGIIEFMTGNPITGSNLVLDRYGADTGLARQNLRGLSMPYVQNRAGGRTGALILATMFLVVAGPVNYYYFSRKGQIRKIIFTLPLISLFFCGIIAVYFILTQGLQRRGGSMSLTLVDEGANKGFTFGRHSLLSGLYPLGGFQFGLQTYFQPLLNGDGRGFEADFNLSNTQNLTDGLFQPGIPFNYATVTPFTTRERMLYNADDSTLRNGFEQGVKGAVLYSNGRYYVGGAAASGGEIKLELVDDAQVAKPANSAQVVAVVEPMVRLLGQQKLTSQELDNLTAMATGITPEDMVTSWVVYAVLLDGIPKSADSGVEISDGDNLHMMLGLISPAGEEQE